MIKNLASLALLATLAIAATPSTSNALQQPALQRTAAPQNGPFNRDLVFQLRGTAVAETRDIDTDGDGVADTTADCFDVGLFNPKSGNQIGLATDCLSDVNIVIDDGGTAPLGWNLALTGTTFFYVPFFGELVVQGLTTVRPVLQPTERDGHILTHITGANADGGVMYGTGVFENDTGEVRLSGQVDMARLVTDGEIFFDCLFIVDRD